MFGLLSNIAKFLALSLDTTASLVALASEKSFLLSAATIKVLVGIHPILIQVPPYIALLSSTTATFFPSLANVAAKVFPALPNPTTNKSYLTII